MNPPDCTRTYEGSGGEGIGGSVDNLSGRQLLTDADTIAFRQLVTEEVTVVGSSNNSIRTVDAEDEKGGCEEPTIPTNV